MKTSLPDVNVLLALLWPAHEGHAVAQSWFQRSGAKSWATNALTQLGLLRLLTNSVVTHGSVDASAAVDTLREATEHDGHEFWALTGEVAPTLHSIVPGIYGYRQWTDAFLLNSAAARGGVLVTFDAGIKELTTHESAGNLLVLKEH